MLDAFVTADADEMGEDKDAILARGWHLEALHEYLDGNWQYDHKRAAADIPVNKLKSMAADEDDSFGIRAMIDQAIIRDAIVRQQAEVRIEESPEMNLYKTLLVLPEGIAPQTPREQVALVHQALSYFRPSRQEILRRVYGLDREPQSLQGIASELSMTHGSVQTLYYEVRADLRMLGPKVADGTFEPDDRMKGRGGCNSPYLLLKALGHQIPPNAMPEEIELRALAALKQSGRLNNRQLSAVADLFGLRDGRPKLGMQAVAERHGYEWGTAVGVFRQMALGLRQRYEPRPDRPTLGIRGAPYSPRAYRGFVKGYDKAKYAKYLDPPH
jgi:hypothetical protein